MAGIGSLGQQPAPDPESATISHEPDLEETSSANEFQALSRSLRNMALEGVSPEARSRMALYQVSIEEHIALSCPSFLYVKCWNMSPAINGLRGASAPVCCLLVH